MNIFQIISKLFTATDSKWILELEDSQIQPVVIQKFLCLNPASQKAARILDKFVYLNPRMYLSAAWTLLFSNGKKYSKAPFIKYPKKEEQKLRYDFIYDKLKKQFKLSTKEILSNLKFIDKQIEENKLEWFSYYGVPKEKWVLHNMDHNLIKQFGSITTPKKRTNLEDFF